LGRQIRPYLMQLTSNVVGKNLVRPGAIEKMLVPRAIKLAPLLRLQFGPFRLAQSTRGLPQNRPLMREARKPAFSSLVPPPRLRPSAVLPPLPHRGFGGVATE